MKTLILIALSFLSTQAQAAEVRYPYIEHWDTWDTHEGQNFTRDDIRYLTEEDARSLRFGSGRSETCREGDRPVRAGNYKIHRRERLVDSGSGQWSNSYTLHYIVLFRCVR